MANWKYKLDLKEDWRKADRREIMAKELADIVIRKITNSTFYSRADDELQYIIDEFKGIGVNDSFDDFDVVWNEFYDYADFNRIWVVII